MRAPFSSKAAKSSVASILRPESPGASGECAMAARSVLERSKAAAAKTRRSNSSSPLGKASFSFMPCARHHADHSAAWPKDCPVMTRNEKSAASSRSALRLAVNSSIRNFAVSRRLLMLNPRSSAGAEFPFCRSIFHHVRNRRIEVTGDRHERRPRRPRASPCLRAAAAGRDVCPVRRPSPGPEPPSKLTAAPNPRSRKSASASAWAFRSPHPALGRRPTRLRQEEKASIRKRCAR